MFKAKLHFMKITLRRHAGNLIFEFGNLAGQRLISFFCNKFGLYRPPDPTAKTA
nr:MAG TPA: hypothetical protein [Caudoviricetes sp.]